MTPLALIVAERARQKDLWAGAHDWGEGDCSSSKVADTTKLAVLTEEVGEVARAILEQSPTLIDELVQVAAVATAWIEGLLADGT